MEYKIPAQPSKKYNKNRKPLYNVIIYYSDDIYKDIFNLYTYPLHTMSRYIQLDTSTHIHLNAAHKLHYFDKDLIHIHQWQVESLLKYFDKVCQ